MPYKLLRVKKGYMYNKIKLMWLMLSWWIDANKLYSVNDSMEVYMNVIEFKLCMRQEI